MLLRTENITNFIKNIFLRWNSNTDKSFLTSFLVRHKEVLINTFHCYPYTLVWMVFIHDSRFNGVNQTLHDTLLPVMVLLANLYVNNCTCLIILSFCLHLDSTNSCSHEIGYKSVCQPIDVSRWHSTVQVTLVLMSQNVYALLIQLMIQMAEHRIRISWFHKILLTADISIMSRHKACKTRLEGLYYITIEIQLSLRLEIQAIRCCRYLEITTILRHFAEVINLLTNLCHSNLRSLCYGIPVIIVFGL